MTTATRARKALDAAEAPEPAAATPPRQTRLSRTFPELLASQHTREILDVIIVGSGYGGSVAAQALAGLHKIDADGNLVPITVCVLERGKEYQPGEFPRRFEDMPGHLRNGDAQTGTVGGKADGLFDVRMGPDVVALVANGVGGGSLINAGVLLEPQLDDFKPGSEAHRLVKSLKEGWYDQARRALGGASPHNPAVLNTMALHKDAKRVRKTAALGTVAPGMQLPPLTVSMSDAPNAADVLLKACNLCGDCMTGCNVGAKDSLDANLLDQAVRAGARIYTGASVLSLKRRFPRVRDGMNASQQHRARQREVIWELKVSHTDPSLNRRETAPARLRARHVILAAGTLGSTEILLRSRTDRLVFSPRLGQGFSCNGDNLSAIYSMREATQACADEDQPAGLRFVGPTITGSVPLQSKGPATSLTPAVRSFQLQEFSVPGPMRRIFEEVVTTARVLNELPHCDPTRHGREPHGALDPLAVDDLAMSRTLVVGTIGHDDASGVLYLPRPLPLLGRDPTPGTLGIRWADARASVRLDDSHEQVRRRIAQLRRAGQASPTLVANPMWRLLPDKLASLVSQPRGPVLTVHPLGGCRIGPRSPDAPDAGVVDAYGRVRNYALAEDSVFRSLVVLDGAIIPGSLGVNPSLTITATAMRAMSRLTKAWGLRPAPLATPARVIWARRHAPVPEVPALANLPEAPAARGSTEVQVVERLRGDVPLEFGGRTQACVVELTLAYQPLPIGRLMGPLHRRMVVDAADPASRLRIFLKRDWEEHHLKLEPDEVRRRWAVLEARLGGTLEVLGREPSGPWLRSLRSVWAWFLNRGMRDIAEQWLGRDPAPRTGKRESPWSYFKSLISMGTRAGEVRRLDYDLAIAEVIDVEGRLVDLHVGTPRLGEGDVIRASKRLTYGRRANPWRQLTELRVDELATMNVTEPPTLTLDGRFLAGQGFPLLRITRQRNGAVALADLCSFGLYMTRLLASVHLWTFRKPDARPRRQPDRLPGRAPGLPEPEVTELVVDRYPGSNKPVTIRLTRYRKAADPGAAPGRPLVMIHGYSASGNTFTHPSLPTSAASYFCERGRDVWVVDLRTSSGLPSCTYPWSMEQVGLVDIPAALMHVRNVTNQPVDVLAHCIGCVMISMALLTNASEVRDNTIELGPDAWLTSYQLGVLKAFNNQKPDQAHPVIRKLILSQKGPVLRYTDDNILRAFVLQSVRRWLVRDDYQFQPSDDPGVAEQLMDRLLASIPYPDADYDVENPLCPLAHLPWTATRHRMDALYGRAFDAVNMSPGTLDAIDDIFGPISMDTVSQTIHFARADAITNQAGRGEFVTKGRLRERWGGIDTYAIHGANNGLVDVLTQTLLGDHLRSAGVPFSEPDPHSPVYAHLGHQDVLMGVGSRAVFDDLATFLARKGPYDKEEEASPERAPATPQRLAHLPWSGPRFDWKPGPGNAVQLACLSDPLQGKGQLYLLPARRWTDPNGAVHHELIPDVKATAWGDADVSSADWMQATPPVAALQAHLNGPASGLPRDAVPGWLALVLYDPAEARARHRASSPGPERASAPVPSGPSGSPAGGVAAPADFGRMAVPQPTRPAQPRPGPVIDNPGFETLWRPLRDRLKWSQQWRTQLLASAPSGETAHATQAMEDARLWLQDQKAEDVALAFVELADVVSAQRVHTAGAADLPFTFAFGSCQYVTGLLDADVGQASLQQLALLTHAGEQPVRLALFLGDQTYADATAGLIDPTRRDELFDQPNAKAMRARGMRAVLRRVPAFMLLDDHEIKDNWEPLPPHVARRRREDDRRNRQLLKYGARAWSKYQRMRPLHKDHKGIGVGDLPFMAGGLAFRFADTRTGRMARGAKVPEAKRQLMNDQQWKDLKAWLLGQHLVNADGTTNGAAQARHQAQLKFIATPSILLPRRRVTAGDAGQPGHAGGAAARAAYSDAWDGFPVSMAELFAFIVEHQLKNVVFLSGDEHHGMVTRAVLSQRGSDKPPVKIVSIHSSGFYAPFPFANGRPDDLVQHDNFSVGDVQVCACTRFAPAGDGFARVTVRAVDPEAALDVDWMKAGGQFRRDTVDFDSDFKSCPCSGCGSAALAGPSPAATAPT